MKQPHEDIRGTLRDQDDLLSLEPTAIACRRMLVAIGYHLHGAVLVGDPAPKVRRMYERIAHPEIGDFVYEQSTLFRDIEDAFKGWGILVEHRIEWWETDEEYEAHIEIDRAEMTTHGFPEWEPEERMKDHAWYIQYGPQPQDICRWTNCSFLMVPTDINTFRAPVGQPTETGGVVITREDLLGDLADSGFNLKVPRG